MTSGNSSFTEESVQSVSLLWVPHVVIAVAFLSFLCVNFYCYHKKYRERYQRKIDVKETRARMRERRRVLNLVRLRYVVDMQVTQNGTSTNKEVELTDSHAHPTLTLDHSTSERETDYIYSTSSV